MSANVGVIRDRAGLERALAEIARIERDCARLPQTRNMATAALMVTAAALKRDGKPRRTLPLRLLRRPMPGRRSAPSSRSTKRARTADAVTAGELVVA